MLWIVGICIEGSLLYAVLVALDLPYFERHKSQTGGTRLRR